MKHLAAIFFSILLTWQDNSMNETKFTVYRSDCNPKGYNCKPYMPIFDLPPDTVRFFDFPNHNRVFCYKVSGLIDGEELFSNESCSYNP